MKIQTTKCGYKTKEDEYKTRVNDRVIILEELQRARNLGDLSENGAYHAAREKQSFNEGKIKELEYFLKNAVIVENDNDGTVQLGAIVTVKVNSLEKVYEVVGKDEADLINGKLSIDSPVGQSLSGKAVGDVVQISTPAGNIKYEIIKVE